MSTTKALTLDEVKAKLANGEPVTPAEYRAAIDAAGLDSLRNEVSTENEAKRIAEEWDSAYAEYQEVAARTGGTRRQLTETLTATVRDAVDDYVTGVRELDSELRAAVKAAKRAAKEAEMRLPMDLDNFTTANPVVTATAVLDRIIDNTGGRLDR